VVVQNRILPFKGLFTGEPRKWLENTDFCSRDSLAGGNFGILVKGVMSYCFSAGLSTKAAAVDCDEGKAFSKKLDDVKSTFVPEFSVASKATVEVKAASKAAASKFAKASFC
jgi:hypothetical protein